MPSKGMQTIKVTVFLRRIPVGSRKTGSADGQSGKVKGHMGFCPSVLAFNPWDSGSADTWQHNPARVVVSFQIKSMRLFRRPCFVAGCAGAVRALREKWTGHAWLLTYCLIPVGIRKRDTKGLIREGKNLKSWPLLNIKTTSSLGNTH